MRTRAFGPTGEPVPVVGQGTWQLSSTDAAADALAHGLELGMTHVDTAEMYTGSEATIARALDRWDGDREEVLLVSKVLPRNASYQGTKDACQASLDRLGTSYLDVYLLHWWSGEHAIEDTMRAMDDLADDGYVDHVGVSNLDVAQMEAAQAALDHELACNQVEYHLRNREAEDEVIPWCREQGVAVVAYSPFGKDRGGFPTSGRQRDVLEQVAGKHDATPRQVALAWLTREDHVFAIPKAEQVSHVEDNAGAGDLELDDEDVARIDETFPV